MGWPKEAVQMRFHHVGVSVADLDRSVRWYEEVLGFQPGGSFAVPEIGLRGRFMVGGDGVSVELLEQQGSVAGGDRSDPAAALRVRGYGHFALQVADLDTEFARLMAAGARSVWAPQTSPEPGVRMAFVADLDGNLVELIQRPAG